MARGDIYICPVCRTKNEDTRKYCISCGTWLLSETFPAVKYQRKRRGVLKTIGKIIGYTIGAIVILFGVLIYLALKDGGPNTMNTSATIASSEETEAEYKASAQSIEYEVLARNPDNYKGVRVTLKGKVIQVLEQGNDVGLRVNVTEGEYGIWDDTVFITYRRSAAEDRILEEDIITLWGDVEGLQTYETIFGAKVSLPAISAKYIEIQKK